MLNARMIFANVQYKGYVIYVMYLSYISYYVLKSLGQSIVTLYPLISVHSIPIP